MLVIQKWCADLCVDQITMFCKEALDSFSEKVDVVILSR